MWSIIIALLLGLIIGWLDILPKNLPSWTDKGMILGLILLLFVMGLGIGSNQEILRSLNTLGLKAFLIAGASIFGSVLAVLSLKKYILKDDRK